MVLLFSSTLFAEKEQPVDIDSEFLEFLGAWESKDENWQIILDERLWQENEFKEGAGDE